MSDFLVANSVAGCRLPIADCVFEADRVVLSLREDGAKGNFPLVTRINRQSAIGNRKC